jgi:hypothetical protein
MSFGHMESYLKLPESYVGKMYMAFQGCALPMLLQGTWHVPALPFKFMPRPRVASNVGAALQHRLKMFKDLAQHSKTF